MVDIFSYFRRRGAPPRQPALSEADTIDLASMGGVINGTYLDIASGPPPERKARGKQPQLPTPPTPPQAPPRTRPPPDPAPRREPAPDNVPKRPPVENFAPAPLPRPRRQDGNGSAPLERKGVLAVHGVEKTFVGRKVVKGVSLYVRQGEAVGLLGPNGAGKTTVFYMITGLIRADKGRIDLDGHNVTPLPGNLTVQQNLRFFARIYRVERARERIEELLAEFELTRFRDTKCGVLSSGEQTRVSLAKAMLNRPRLVLLDEPTASLDPSSARDVRRRIRALVSGGEGGALWTSHNMLEVQEVCDRVLFLSRGKILLEGDPKQLPAEHGKQSLEELFITVAREPLTLELA